MAVRDGARFLPQAIDSILDQTLEDFEFIIVDNRSTDETPNILSRFARQDSRIRVYESNSGLAGALNLGCGVARGTYIGIMDSDDVAFPDKLDRQIEFLQEHPNVALTGGGIVQVDDQGTRYGETLYPSADAQIREALKDGPAFCHPTIVMRRQAYLKTGGYRTAFPLAVDYDFELRFADRFKMANIPSPVLYHRMHLGNVTVRYRKLGALSSLAAQISSKSRKLSGHDPIDGVDTITEQVLREWGTDEQTLSECLIGALMSMADTMMRFRYLDRALEFLHEATNLTRGSDVRKNLVGNLHWKYGVIYHRRGELLRSIPSFVRGSLLNPLIPVVEIVNRVKRAGTYARQSDPGIGREKPPTQNDHTAK